MRSNSIQLIYHLRLLNLADWTCQRLRSPWLAIQCATRNHQTLTSYYVERNWSAPTSLRMHQADWASTRAKHLLAGSQKHWFWIYRPFRSLMSCRSWTEIQVPCPSKIPTRPDQIFKSTLSHRACMQRSKCGARFLATVTVASWQFVRGMLQIIIVLLEKPRPRLTTLPFAGMNL